MRHRVPTRRARRQRARRPVRQTPSTWPSEPTAGLPGYQTRTTRDAGPDRNRRPNSVGQLLAELRAPAPSPAESARGFSPMLRSRDDSVCPMQSTMQDFPLTVAAILRYAVTVHGDRRSPPRPATATGTPLTGRSAGRPPGWPMRCAASASEGDERVATFMWNNQEHLAGLRRGAVDGRGAAHAEHPALPRADRVRRLRGRGPGGDRRPVAGADPGPGAADSWRRCTP